MTQLRSESDDRLSYWKHQILAALGENAQVIIEVIPELEQIIGSQLPVPELSGNAAQNRFDFLFQKFIRVFTAQSRPLVIFLDDLQWADLASLKLMKLLAIASDISHLLTIGAYRDREVFATHPLMLTLNEIEEEGLTLNKINLAPLTASDLNQLIADTHSCSSEIALPLTQLVYQKTKGNPFFCIQFLKALHDDCLISFNAALGHWQCDLAEIKTKAVTDNVVEFLARRLQKLPAETQEILQLAACIGDRFDLETLAIGAQRSLAATAELLWEALQEGFILPTSEVYKFYRDRLDDEDSSELPRFNTEFPDYRFLHDRVQQAVYSLLTPEAKKIKQLQISQLLLERISAAEVEEKIFDLVNRLNYAVELIVRPQERERLLQLNLTAGKKAKNTTAYAAAIEYLKMGIKLLPADCWQTNYALTLTLYEEAIEAAYLWGDFQQMEVWKDILLSQARSVLDRLKTYEVQIAACVARNQLREAIAIALSVLQQLGIEFPPQPTFADWQQGIEEVTGNLAGKPVASAIDLPLMNDPSSQAALRILLSIDAPSYLSFPELLPLTICQQVNLSLGFGNAPGSAKAYANYGLILCSGLGDLATGYQFGQLAIKLLEKLEAKEIYARTSFLVNFFIRHWQEPLRHTLKSLQEAYAIALETGDLTHGAIAAEKYCHHAYFAGEVLYEFAKCLLQIVRHE